MNSMITIRIDSLLVLVSRGWRGPPRVPVSHALVGAACTEDERFVERATDDLRADRQSLAVEAARKGERGEADEVDRCGQAGEVGAHVAGEGGDQGGRDRCGGREQEVDPCQRAQEALAD